VGIFAAAVLSRKQLLLPTPTVKNFFAMPNKLLVFAVIASALVTGLASAQPSYQFRQAMPGLRAQPAGPTGQPPAPPAAAPVAVFSTTALDFASVSLGQSATRAALLTNTGDAPMTVTVGALGAAAASAGFSLTHNCPASLAPAASCTLQAGFAPTTTGAASASFAVTTNAAGSPHSVSLSAYALPAVPLASLSTGGLDFGAVEIGQSATRSATLTNTGGAPLTVAVGALSAAATSAGFSLSHNCPASLDSGASCAMQASLTPVAAGTVNAAFSVATNAADSPHTVSLTGAGVGASLLHVTADAGTVEDVSGVPLTNAGPVTATAINAFAGQSLSFPHTLAYLETNSAANHLGTADFTMEAWVRTPDAAANQTIFSNYRGAPFPAGNVGWTLALSAGSDSSRRITFWASAIAGSGPPVLVSTAQLNNNQWHHVAVTRTGSTLRLFIDGQLQATVTSAVSLDGSPGVRPLTVAARDVSGHHLGWRGLMDNVRVIRGEALYTVNFVP
jgi:hypothetical protein